MSDRIEARPGALTVTRHCSFVFRHIVPHGVTLADCCRASYWQDHLKELAHEHVAGKRPFHSIELIAEDGSWEADIRVLKCNPADKTLSVRVIREYCQPEFDRKLPAGFSVEFIKGAGWRVFSPRHEMIAECLRTEAMAYEAARADVAPVGAAN